MRCGYQGFGYKRHGRPCPQGAAGLQEKAPYLDCDTIVNGSIRPPVAGRTELGNYLAGMVMEPTVYMEMKESIGMEKG